MQAFGRNGYGPKIGGEGCAPLGEGELGLYVTQCDQGRGLPACQVSSWSVEPFGHNTPTLQSDRQDRTGQTDILKRGANSANFMKIAQGVRTCRAFIFHILIISQ